jgi:hypothetical protein
MSLKEWFGKGPKGDWVDIGAPKKDGKFQKCGRAKGSKRKYPKCVPRAKAKSMTAGEFSNGGEVKKRKRDKMPKRNKKNFRPTKAGAGMTEAGVRAYRKANPGSKLQTAVTEKKPTGKRAARRKSFCARSAGQMKKFPKAAKDPNSRLRQARRRWRC